MFQASCREFIKNTNYIFEDNYKITNLDVGNYYGVFHCFTIHRCKIH